MQKDIKLIGDRIILRKFELSDAKDVFEYASDNLTTKYLTWPSHTTIEDSICSLKNFLMNDGAFAITLKSGGKVIGCIDIRVDENESKASFGYVLNRLYWNNGYMSEALNLIIDYGFKYLKVDEIYGLCEKENIGSKRVMIKTGMKFMCFIKDLKIHNKIADYEKYSIFSKNNN